MIMELISVCVRDDRVRGVCKELFYSNLTRVAALDRANDLFTKNCTHAVLHFDTQLCYLYRHIVFFIKEN